MQSLILQSEPLVSTAAAVSASGLVRRYGEGDTSVHALRDVSLDIAEGQLTAVMGPSGSGKSTLMHILAGLDKPTEGEVTIAGTEITTLDDTQLTKLRRDHIGFIFQFFNLLPMLTAEENIVLPLDLAGQRVDREWLDELVQRVGLGDRLKHRPSEMSGGQQQRVAVARALVSRPTVMFADEPTGNLDSRTGAEILDAHARVRRRARPDDGDGHPRRARRGDRRPRALPRRRRDRQGPPALQRPHDPVGPRRGHHPMIKVALKGLAGRKIRALLTAFAVIIGVSMVSGTFVLTDTMQKSFDGIFETSYENTDVIVSGHQVVESETADVPTVPSSLLRDVRALPEVDAAAGSIMDDTTAKVIGRDGDSLAGQNPTIVSALDYTQPQLSPLKLDSGEWAKGDDEIAIDASTAKKHDYAIGDTISVAANGPVEQYTITGIAKFGEVDSLGGAVIAVFDMPTAQALLHQERRLRRARDHGRGRHVRGAAPRRRQRDRAEERRRQARLAGGQGRRQGDQRGPRLRADLPARLRRHRAVRGRVRDLQHPVDHRRPAHA